MTIALLVFIFKMNSDSTQMFEFHDMASCQVAKAQLTPAMEKLILNPEVLGYAMQCSQR